MFDPITAGGWSVIPGDPTDTLVRPDGRERHYVDGEPLAALLADLERWRLRALSAEAQRPDETTLAIASHIDNENSALLARINALELDLQEAEKKIKHQAALLRVPSSPDAWRTVARHAMKILFDLRVSERTLDYHGLPLGQRWTLHQYNCRMANASEAIKEEAALSDE